MQWAHTRELSRMHAWDCPYLGLHCPPEVAGKTRCDAMPINIANAMRCDRLAKQLSFAIEDAVAEMSFGRSRARGGS